MTDDVDLKRRATDHSEALAAQARDAERYRTIRGGAGFVVRYSGVVVEAEDLDDAADNGKV